MTNKIKLLHNLIGKIMEYNEISENPIYVELIPHVKGVVLFRYETPDNDSKLERLVIYYDDKASEITRLIEVVESWLKD